MDQNVCSLQVASQQRRQHRNLHANVVVCAWLLCCFVASIISIRNTSCTSCAAAAELISGLPLAYLGVALYATLLTLLIFRGQTLLLRIMVFGACGVHAGLLYVLFRSGSRCPACLAAALGALAACTSIAFSYRRLKELGCLTAIFMIVGLSVGAITSRWIDGAPTRSMLNAALAVSSAAPRPPDGMVVVIVLERTGCSHCIDFAESTLPAIREHFGTVLSVTFREAPAGVAVPVSVVIARRRFAIRGNHPPAEIIPVLDAAVVNSEMVVKPPWVYDLDS